MAKTHNFKVGDRVEFRPTHQTNLKLEGYVTGVDDSNVVEVQYDAQNKSELPRVYPANAKDCVLTTKQGPNPHAKKATAPAVTTPAPAANAGEGTNSGASNT